MKMDVMGLITPNNETVALVGVKVEADLVGRGARVKLCQEFRNTEKMAIEVVYRFPLPENATICGFRAHIDERIIAGEIDEREQAFERYDNALGQGHGAYLLDQERPNIFTLSLGNLLPGSSAFIELEYLHLLESRANEVRFCLPTTISPRYLPAAMPERDGIPETRRIHPSYASQVPYGLSLQLRVHDSDQVLAIESPSHQIRVGLGTTPLTVAFAAESVAMDRDFVVTIQYRRETPVRAYYCYDPRGGFYQLDFTPGPESDASDQNGTARREVLFLLDCSGSMEGSSIQQARKAIEIFVRGLPGGIWFNVYRFGSSFQTLFSESQPYSNHSAEEALSAIYRMEANLGGTEILAPLQQIFQTTPGGQRELAVVLITDGQVGNESQVLELVRNGGRNIRIFPVGIGHGPNEYFIKELARSSNASSEMITPQERIEPKILRLFKKVMAPTITDFEIDWGVAVEQAPEATGVFGNEPTSFWARCEATLETAHHIAVTARVEGMMQEWSVPIFMAQAGEQAPLPLLWARETIRGLEAGIGQGGSRQAERKVPSTREKSIRISKEFGIICQATSFIAVERRRACENNCGQDIVLRQVPTLITHGWHGQKKSVSQGQIDGFRAGAAGQAQANMPQDEDRYGDSFSVIGPLGKTRRASPSSDINSDIFKHDASSLDDAPAPAAPMSGDFEECEFAAPKELATQPTLADRLKLAKKLKKNKESPQSEHKFNIMPSAPVMPAAEPAPQSTFAPDGAATDTPEIVVIRLLELQRPGGGFRFNDNIAQSLGIKYERRLHRMVQRLRLQEGGEGFILLWTALLLAFLEFRCADYRDIWEGTIQKSQNWFNREIDRCQLKGNGQEIRRWADEYIQRLPQQLNYPG